MGSNSSKPETTADKVASKAEKVLKSVNGDCKAAASDVKKGVDKAATKTNKEVNKAIDTLLEDSKKAKSHTTEIAVGVPLVALIVAGGYYLWKKQPWKKSDKTATA